jgi:hypothetical protein
MPENLICDGTIHLFGRKSDDLTLSTATYGNGAVATAVSHAVTKADAAATKGDKGQTIARIYAFAFQNEFFELASPALFIVSNHKGKVGAGPTLDFTGLSRTPANLNPELDVWTVERDDLTVRLDIMAGTFTRVLLDYELAESGLQDFVRGGKQLGTPTAVSSRTRRPRGWRSDDE